MKTKKILSVMISLTLVFYVFFSMGIVSVSAEGEDYRSTFTVASDGTGTIPAKQVEIFDDFSTSRYRGNNVDWLTDGSDANFRGANLQPVKWNNIEVDAANGWLKVGNGEAQGATVFRDYSGEVHGGENYTVSFSFKMDNLAEITALYQGKHPNEAYSFTAGPHISIGQSGSDYYLRYHKNGADNLISGTKLQNGKWYRVVLNVNVATQKYDIFLNGRQVAGSCDFFYAGGSKFTVKECLYDAIVLDSGNNVVYYDDIAIYQNLTGRTNYYMEDFSGMTGRVISSQEPMYANQTSGFTAIKNASIVDEDGNSVLKLTPANEDQATVRLGANGTGSYESAAFDVSLGKKENLAFRFKFDTEIGNSAAIGGIRTGGTHYGFRLFLIDNDLKIGLHGVDGNNTPAETIAENLKANTWYSVIMSADISDINGETQTGGKCAVYLAEDGGEYKCLGIDFPFKWVQNANYLDHSMISRAFDVFVDYNQELETQGSIYYDDLVIYHDAREDVLKSVAATIEAEEAELSTDDPVIVLPGSDDERFSLTWSKGEGTVSENDTVTFMKMDTVQKYTANVAGIGEAYIASRAFEVNVPSIIETTLNYKNDTATATVVINTNDKESFVGYDDGGVAILGVFGTDNSLKSVVKIENIQDGKATVAKEFSFESGKYTFKLFLFVKDSLAPISDSVESITVTK